MCIRDRTYAVLSALDFAIRERALHGGDNLHDMYPHNLGQCIVVSRRIGEAFDGEIVRVELFEVPVDRPFVPAVVYIISIEVL